MCLKLLYGLLPLIILKYTTDCCSSIIQTITNVYGGCLKEKRKEKKSRENVCGWSMLGGEGGGERVGGGGGTIQIKWDDVEEGR